MSSENQKPQSVSSDAMATAQPPLVAAKTTPTVNQSSSGSRYQLFNSSGGTMCVPIVNKATGENDSVFVQHGGKPKLLAGFTVDPVFAARNPALQVSKVSN